MASGARSGAWGSGSGALHRRDPDRPEAGRCLERLGYRLHEGRWVSRRATGRRSGRAEATGRPTVDGGRSWRTTDGGSSTPPDARRPRPGWRVADPGPSRRSSGSSPPSPRAARAVQLLGQIDAPSASRALAILAVAAKSADARRAATETLRVRDPREYADFLISLLREPIRFEVKHVGGPGSPGELLVEGKRANVRRSTHPPPSSSPMTSSASTLRECRSSSRSVEPTTGSLDLGP